MSTEPESRDRLLDALEHLPDAVSQAVEAAIAADRTIRLEEERSPSLGQLVAALARARKEFGEIKKDKEGKIKGQARGSGREYEYTYKYASLDQAIEATADALADQELVVFNGFPEANREGVTVVAELWHSSGEFKKVRLRMPFGEFTPHAIGSAITYGRRYVYLALLNLAPAEDDDGGKAQEGATRGGGGQRASGQGGGGVPGGTEEIAEAAAKEPERAVVLLAQAVAAAGQCGDTHENKMARLYEVAASRGYDRPHVDKVLRSAKANPAHFPWKAWNHALAMFENLPLRVATSPDPQAPQAPPQDLTWEQSWDAVRNVFYSANEASEHRLPTMAPSVLKSVLETWARSGWPEDAVEFVLGEELKVAVTDLPPNGPDNIFRMISQILNRFRWADVAALYPDEEEVPVVSVDEPAAEAEPGALGEALAAVSGDVWIADGFESAYSAVRRTYEALRDRVPEALVPITPDDRLKLFTGRLNGGRRPDEAAAFVQDMIGVRIEELPAVLFEPVQRIMQTFPPEPDGQGVPGVQVPDDAKLEAMQPKDLQALVKNLIASGSLDEDTIPRSGPKGNPTKGDLVQVLRGLRGGSRG
jgi:hypothetical protein